MSELLFGHLDERVVVHPGSADDDSLWPEPLLPKQPQLVGRDELWHVAVRVRVDSLLCWQVGSTERLVPESNVLEDLHEVGVHLFVVQLQLVRSRKHRLFHLLFGK